MARGRVGCGVEPREHEHLPPSGVLNLRGLAVLRLDVRDVGAYPGPPLVDFDIRHGLPVGGCRIGSVPFYEVTDFFLAQSQIHRRNVASLELVAEARFRELVSSELCPFGPQKRVEHLAVVEIPDFLFGQTFQVVFDQGQVGLGGQPPEVGKDQHVMEHFRGGVVKHDVCEEVSIDRAPRDVGGRHVGVVVVRQHEVEGVGPASREGFGNRSFSEVACGFHMLCDAAQDVEYPVEGFGASQLHRHVAVELVVPPWVPPDRFQERLDFVEGFDVFLLPVVDVA